MSGKINEISIANRKWMVFCVLLIAAIVLSVTAKPPQPSGLQEDASSPSQDPAGRTGTPTPAPEYKPLTQPHRIDPPAQPVPAQIVIRFAQNTTQEDRAAYVESVGGTVVQSIDSLDAVVVSVPEEVAQEPLPDSPAVEQAETDYFVVALDETAPVDDPRYPEQWALPAIGAPSAWAELPPDAAAVTVAVIDSGICASHPDLSGRILAGTSSKTTLCRRTTSGTAVPWPA
jgi:subtilisin family serine protease